MTREASAPDPTLPPLPTVSADAVVAGVLDLVGMKAFALEGMLALSAVRWSREVTTACIDFAATPCLLLNPEFVARSCTTPERLAMLILHELSHVTLAHTRIATRVTRAQNIAFDAIINRSLLLALEEAKAETARFAELLCDLYRPDVAPEFLLRPPARGGEPSRGIGRLPRALRDIHARLYGPAPTAAAAKTLTYGEIVEALERSRPTWDAGRDAPVLLGSHGDTPLEQMALGGQATGDLHARFPGAFAALEVRGGLGAHPELASSAAALAVAAREAHIEALLRTALVRALLEGHGEARAVARRERPALTALPGRDRRGPARVALARAFGAPVPLFFQDTVPEVIRERHTVHLYLDVSGSMHHLLPRLFAALASLHDRLSATLWQFSTVVEPLTGDEVRRGRVRTTGGTEITPVLRHVTAMGELAPRKVLILTDGLFTPPPPALRAEALRAGREVHAVVLGGSTTNGRWATSVQTLTLPPAIR